jgi:hypothetical protein
MGMASVPSNPAVHLTRSAGDDNSLTALRATDAGAEPPDGHDWHRNCIFNAGNHSAEVPQMLVSALLVASAMSLTMMVLLADLL